ncbi:hypothetical protein WAE61_15995 [Comamonadaceae bacterium PP-2]
MPRSHRPFTLQQAMSHAPGLARLAELAQASNSRMRTIEPLIPAMLRPAVRPGPLDGEAWCLLVDSTAVAAKLRQLLPAFEAHLRTKGWPNTKIRLKVHLTQARRAP